MKKIIILIVLFSAIITSSSLVISTVSNKNQVIYLDAGHGGRDIGGEGSDDTYEKDINLKITFYLKEQLENAGFEVLLTRNGDYDLASDGASNRKREDIRKRVKLIDDSACLLYISIHANTYTSPSIRGAQTFYNKKIKESKILANYIQESLIYQLQNTNRDAKEISGKYIIDNATKVGCLVEVGFLSNPSELELLRNAKYQEKVAFAIFMGIVEYVEKG